MNNFLIDTHCHLNMAPFKDDIDEVIQNAKYNGVKYLHTICTNPLELHEHLAIAEKYENIYASVGLHPDNVKAVAVPTVEEIVEYSKHPKIISFGETGLDYYHEGQYPPAQKKSFINHIQASALEKMPVIVHTREAENDTIDLLSTEMKNAQFTGVIHCFTASYEFAKKVLDLGLYISIAGIVTFKNAKELQETVSKLPLDMLLIETDAPYLAPMPYRGKRNEPAFVKNTAEFLTKMFNVSFEEIANVTTENAKKLFTKGNFR